MCYLVGCYLKVFGFDPVVPFKPVVESNTDGAFLPEDPIDTIKSGKSAHIPFITGVTTEEGAVRSAGNYKCFYLFFNTLMVRFDYIK